MRCQTFTTLAFVTVLTTGCATTTQHRLTARAINYDEASSFERSLKNGELTTLVQLKPELFVQPVNKKEACKLPTTQDQMERANVRTYWDGACKDGYAFGLGRDIAISDTHHVEEITIHNGTGDSTESPSVLYDFVNARVRYSTPHGKFPASSWIKEEIQSGAGGFHISFTTGVTDEFGNNSVAVNSPLNPTRLLVNDRRNVVYKFTDNSGVHAADPSAVSFAAETIDPKTKLAGGVVIVRHANGQVRHLKLTGASPEAVILPVEYVNDLIGKLKSTQDALTTAQSNIERARQIEREYLYLACNGKHVIDGLDSHVATKICNWRSQFKDPYEKSLAKYTNDMEAQKRKVESANQQHIAHQQLDLQQTRLQQQQSQIEVQQLNNALTQFGQQMQNTSQQMLSSVMSQPAPQVNFTPFTSSGSDQIRCIKTGPVTNCRY